MTAAIVLTAMMIQTLCGHQGGRPPASRPNPESFRLELAKLPSWASITPYRWERAQDRYNQQMLRVARSLDGVPNGSLPTLFRYYVRQEERRRSWGTDDMSRLFVLVRFLFEVKGPSRALRGVARGFVGPGGRSVTPSWPVREVNGVPKVVSCFAGYLGPPYDALGELRAFAKSYRRRYLGRR